MSQESLSTQDQSPDSLTRLQRALSAVSTDDDEPINADSSFKRSKSGSDVDFEIDVNTKEPACSSDSDSYNCLELLAVIKDHPSIYDPMDPSFRTNRKQKDKIWNDIRMKLNLDGTGDNLEKQWNLLKKKYRDWRNQTIDEPNNVFAKMFWFDNYIVPLPERAPLFDAMYKLQNLLAEKKTKHKPQQAMEKSPETLPERSTADVFDVSTEELEQEISSITVATPPPPKKKKAVPRRLYPTSGLRRSARHSSANNSTLSSQ